MLAACLAAAVWAGAKKGEKSSKPPEQKSVGSYDPSRDPEKDLQNAIAQARQAHKRILLDVGGDWCVYCNIMDATFATHPGLRKVRDANYITVKVNYSPENPNAVFLSKYPKIIDYPHFFVLDSDGKLVQSQPTHKFEHGKTYNAGKIEDFLKKYSGPPRHWLNRVS